MRDIVLDIFILVIPVPWAFKESEGRRIMECLLCV
jgi:hypothetical protein